MGVEAAGRGSISVLYRVVWCALGDGVNATVMACMIGCSLEVCQGYYSAMDEDGNTNSSAGRRTLEYQMMPI